MNCFFFYGLKCIGLCIPVFLDSMGLLTFGASNFHRPDAFLQLLGGQN